jgi:hypothetical protein
MELKVNSFSKVMKICIMREKIPLMVIIMSMKIYLKIKIKQPNINNSHVKKPLYLIELS